jgi:hypothetical protein
MTDIRLTIMAGIRERFENYKRIPQTGSGVKAAYQNHPISQLRQDQRKRIERMRSVAAQEVAR